jgi:uncharacterized protein with FMN-binding domain
LDEIFFENKCINKYNISIIIKSCLMKKILLSGAVIVVFAGYALYQHFNSTPAIVPVTSTTSPSAQTPISQNPPTNQTPSSGTSPATQPSAAAATASGTGAAGTQTQTAAAPTPAPTTAAPSSGKFKDGTYTGSVADAFYGNVQVAAVISGGKLTDVQILEYPSDRGHSQQLGQQAMPILRSEAIAAQSSVVNIVSGATQDSQAFQQSLQSALSQAM